MPTYIVLGQFTDQGIRNVKETTKRAQALKDMAKKFGATVNAVYWTLGQYRHRDDCRRTGRHVRQRAAPERRCARQCPNPDAPRLLGRRDRTDSRQDGLDRAADGSSSTLVACRRVPSAFCSCCGETPPLVLPGEPEREDVMAVLLESGADVNARGHRALDGSRHPNRERGAEHSRPAACDMAPRDRNPV